MFIFSGDKIIYLFTVSRGITAATVRCNDKFYYLIENQISEDDNLKSRGNVPDI